jgi:MFS family permease
MRVAFRFALGYALLSFTYSIYYTVSRPLYGVDVYGRSFVLFIAGAEYIPAVFSFLIGSLSDFIGRRRFMLFSIMGAAPLALIFLQREPLPLLLSISLYSFFNGLASMIGLSSVLESREGRGEELLGHRPRK